MTERVVVRVPVKEVVQVHTGWPPRAGMGVALHAAEHAAMTNKIPYILAQSAIPVCLAPNGTVATNGVVTLGTALPTTYSGGIWLRLPANAIVGGAAGLYWAVMSSTTQGQVYTNFADPATQFIPSIPSGTLVEAVGSNAAYTQTTAADVTLVNVTLPGGAMGDNGSLRGMLVWQTNNSAGAKTVKNKLGASSFAERAAGSQLGGSGLFLLSNRGSLASQVSLQPAGSGLTSPFTDAARGAPYAVNTAVQQAITVTGQLATATDYFVLGQYVVEILPS